MPTFPTFRQVGAAIDMPVAPLQYKPLNFTGLIDTMLKKESLGAKQRQPSTSKNNEFKLVATTGMAKQWQNQMDAIQNEKNQLASFYGAENFAYMPEYRQLVAQEEKLQTPYVLNAAQNAKDQVDAAQEKVAAAKAENFYNIPYLLNTGLAIPNSKLLNAQEMGYGKDLAILQSIPSNQILFNPELELNVDYYSDKDAITHLNAITANLGSDKLRIENAWNELGAGLDPSGTTFGTTNTTTQTVKEYFTNNGKFEINDRGEIVLDKDRPGAIQEANALALNSLFTGNLVNSTSPLSGIFQGFLQGTKSTSSAGKSTSSAVFTKDFARVVGFEGTEGLLQRKYNYKTDEELKSIGVTEKDKIEKYKNLDKTHFGYYYKEDIKDANGNIIGLKGQLDLNLLSKDVVKYSTEFIATALNVKVQDVRSILSKTTTDFDEYNEGAGTANNIVQTDAFANQANQYNESSLVNVYTGVTEDELKSMLTNTKQFGLYSTSLGADANEMIQYLDKLGPDSPFTASVVNGKKQYKANDNFDANSVQAKLQAKYESEGLASGAAKNKATMQVENMQRMWQMSKDAQLGAEGLTTNVGTIFSWGPSVTTGYFNGEIIKNIQTMFGSKDEGGQVVYKTGNDLPNVKIKAGTGFYNGQHFLGDANIVGTTNEINLQLTGIPQNAGLKMKPNQSFTFAGKTYSNNDFVPAKILDALDNNQINQLMAVADLGSGYWTIRNGKAVNSGVPDLSAKSTVSFGKNSESIYSNLILKTQGNEVERAPYQYSTTIRVKNEKNKQVEHWKKNNVQISVEDYTYNDPEAQKFWNASYPSLSGSRNILRMTSPGAYIMDGRGNEIDEENYIYNLRNDKNITPTQIKNIFDKYRDATGNVPYSYIGKIREDVAKTMAGGNVNWSQTKTLTSIPIINPNTGNIDRRAEKLLGIRYDGKELEYNVKVEIPGTMTSTYTENAAKNGLKSMMQKQGTNQQNTNINFNAR